MVPPPGDLGLMGFMTFIKAWAVAALLAVCGITVWAEEAPPGARCAAGVVEPRDVERLPSELSGLEVFVRLRPGEGTAAAAAADAVRERSGSPAFLIDGTSDVEASAVVASPVDKVLI